MRMPLVLLTLTFLACPAAAAFAQGPAPIVPALPSWAPSALPLRSASVVRDTLPHSHPTHWQAGLAFGASLGALLGGAFASALCNASEIQSGCTGPTVGGALLTATALGMIGAMIGGAVPKRA